MHALIDPGKRGLERGTRECARGRGICGRRGIVDHSELRAHVTAPSIPGLRMFDGSNARFTR